MKASLSSCISFLLCKNSMFERYWTRGLIIKKEDRGEADRLLTFYTKDFGKLEIFGKAIRKINSKLRARADVFYLSEIEFIQGRIYKTLTDALLLEKFKNLRKDLKKIALAQKIAEVLDQLARKEGGAEEKVWQLLLECFIILNGGSVKSERTDIVYFYFFWNLLSLSGYMPQLYNCAVCQKTLTPGELYFNAKEGGVVCEKCHKAGRAKNGLMITPDAVKIIRLILKKNWDAVSRVKIGADEQRALKIICENQLSYVQI